MLRLTGNERAVAEICATAEHMASLTAAATAFQLTPEMSGPDCSPQAGSTVALLDETTAPEAAATLAEIKIWAAQALGSDKTPDIWRALAHHPGFLDVTWRKNRLILGAGVLDELVKACAALAVAQFRSSAYWTAYMTRFLRQSCGFDDRALVEVTAMMMHSLSFNTVAHGMRVPPPYDNLSASDFESGGRLAGTSGPPAAEPSKEPAKN